jgi:hypothetical protein
MDKTQKQHILFEVVSDNVKDYGISGLSYILGSQLKPPDHFQVDPPISELFYNLKSFVNTYGIEKTIYYLQREKRYLEYNTDFKEEKEKFTEKIFDIVSEVFDTNSKELINKDIRDGGKRIYSSGTITKLFFEVLNYPLDEIITLIPKTKSVISRHKFAITKLDYRHPYEKKILCNFLTAKFKLINFILS